MDNNEKKALTVQACYSVCITNLKHKLPQYFAQSQNIH